MKQVSWLLIIVLGGCSGGSPGVKIKKAPIMDGHKYETIKIGNQEWFAENLSTTVYASGDAIPANLSDMEWSHTERGALAVYEGAILYNWYAVNDVRRLCPTGWHIPTDTEWTQLIEFLGGESAALDKLKNDSGWEENGTNTSGLSVLPHGIRNGVGYLLDAGYRAEFWTSSPNGDKAYSRIFIDDGFAVYRNYGNRRAGCSVRCVKD